MKLLIDNNLVATFSVDPSSTEKDFLDTAADFAEVSAICDKFCVRHTISLGTTIGSKTVFTIPVQKITLDSVNVNELLYEVFYLFDFVYDIEYSALGGRGCDLALTITKRSY